MHCVFNVLTFLFSVCLMKDKIKIFSTLFYVII